MRKLVFAATMLASGLALASGPSTDMPATTEAAAPVATTFAFHPGIVAGIELGYADTGKLFNWPKEYYDFGIKQNHHGFAGRIHLGYEFTENLEAELGYVYLPEWKQSPPKPNEQFPYNYIKSRPSIVDLFVKGTLPINNEFNVFARFGAGWVHYPKPKTDLGKEFYQSISKITPAVGLGAAYNFNENISVDVKWNYYFKSGSTDDIKYFRGFRAINFFGIGATYKFDL
jgi:hypothetical protein